MKPEILKRETHKSYADLLSAPEWHEFSKRIKMLRDGRCENCESEEQLQVHHLGYRDGLKPWEYQDDEVMVLCEPCHSEIHSYADAMWNEALKCKNMWIIYECKKAVSETLRKHQQNPSSASAKAVSAGGIIEASWESFRK